MSIKLNSYQQVLDFLYSSLPMYQRVGAVAMKKNLDNILALCSVLDDPQDKFPSIHVAGTNGKGSTAHILSALYQSQGLRVGLYTSPHYKDFRERIKIDNHLVSEKFVIDFVQRNLASIERIRPSFFEITVAMAFYYFAEQKVDIAIIEVGLGGRLDSTNIITPLVSVITNISLDHTQFLGDTVEEIAGEKAGIIKEKIPVVVGEHQITDQVFLNIAGKKNSKIAFAEDILDCKYQSEKNSVQVKGKDFQITFEADWFAEYQLLNLRTAVATFLEWSNVERVKINWAKIPEFLSDLPERTYFLGRWMLLGESPLIIAESAHNEAGLKLLAKKLASLQSAKSHLILGFSDDKKLASVWRHFPSNARYYFVKANVPRGLDAKLLKSEAAKSGVKGRTYKSVKHAIIAAKRHATKDDLIFIGGSIFVVAEAI